MTLFLNMVQSPAIVRVEMWTERESELDQVRRNNQNWIFSVLIRGSEASELERDREVFHYQSSTTIVQMGSTHHLKQFLSSRGYF